MWDGPFGNEEDGYGKEPNSFLVSVISLLEPGRTLCVGEGGHNAVYLASLGFEVVAVDDSVVALEKAQRLAEERNVTVETHLVDWGRFDLGEEQFENVISVFCHLPARQRRRLHAAVLRTLRPGGMLVLEAFRPEQLKYDSGGPRDITRLVSRAQLYAELDGLEWLRVGQVEKNLNGGRGALLEVLARKRYVHRPMGMMH